MDLSCFFELPVTKRSSAAVSKLPPTFQWSQIGPHFIELSWNVTQLGKWYANIIKLSATGISYHFDELETTEFIHGSITLGNLRPNTPYKMTVKVLKIARFLRTYTDVVTTAPEVSLRTQFKYITSHFIRLLHIP